MAKARRLASVDLGGFDDEGDGGPPSEPVAFAPNDDAIDEIKRIDAEIIDIGDPREHLEAVAQQLRDERVKLRELTFKAEKTIGDLEHRLRVAQKEAGRAGDRLDALRARRKLLSKRTG